MLEEYKDVLTTSEVAEILSVSNQTVRSLIRMNKIKSFMIGRGYRVTKRDLMKYINQEG